MDEKYSCYLIILKLLYIFMFHFVHYCEFFVTFSVNLSYFQPFKTIFLWNF